jgi:nitrite reductase (NADH) large subunit
MSGISVAVVGLLCGVLLVRPELGLKITWTVFAPLLPAVFVVAPSLWRNICPFAFVNQVPRLAGLTFGRQLPRNLARHAFAVAAVGFVGLVVLRRLVLDRSGPATAVTIGAGLVLAFVGGVAIRGKAGWCGTFCPMYAAQRLYGRHPLVQVRHAHCSTCVGCVSPCVDLNPSATAAAEDIRAGRTQNLNGRSQQGRGQRARSGNSRAYHLLVGAAPGLSVGYFTSVEAPIVATIPVAGTVLAVLGPAVASLCAYLGLSAALRPARDGVHRLLTSGFVAVAGGLFYVFTVPIVFATWQWDLPLLTAGLQALAVAAAGWWWIREARAGLSLHRSGPRTDIDGAAAPGHAKVRQRAQELRLLQDTWRGRPVLPDSRRTPIPEPPDGSDPGVRSVVVVGNGIAGLAAADALRKLHPSCDVHLIDDGAQADPDPLTPAWFAEHGITAHVGVTATSLDAAAHQVTLNDGTQLGYDRLILATGAIPADRDIQGLPLPGAYSLRTVGQASAICHHVESHRDLRTAVVVGAGALGINVATTLAGLGLKVHLVDRRDRPGSRLVDERAGYLLITWLTELGVELHLGAAVRWADGAHGVTSVRLESGVRLNCDVLLLCTGTRPDVRLANTAGLSVRTGVVVDHALRTDDPHVFAVGDVAEHPGGVGGPWYAAVEQAEVAAAQAVARTPADACRYLPGPTMTRLDLPGLQVVSIGMLSTSNGEQVVVFDDPPLRYVKVLLSSDGSVHGCVVVNDAAAAETLHAIANRGTDVRPHLDLLRSGHVTELLQREPDTRKRRRRRHWNRRPLGGALVRGGRNGQDQLS